MAEVKAEVYSWTAMGMSTYGGIGEYVEKLEVERLFEEADRRGYERALTSGPRVHQNCPTCRCKEPA